MTFEKTQTDLKESLKQLETEKNLRTKFETKAIKLEIKSENLNALLKDTGTGLSEARGALIDVTKSLNREHTRKERLEKRTHALYVKSDRLQTKIDKVSKESNKKNDELTASNTESAQRNEQLMNEVAMLREYICQSRDTEASCIRQLDEERNTHMQTRSMLEARDLEAASLRTQVADHQRELFFRNKQLSGVRKEREALRERLRRATTKLNELAGYKKQVRKSLNFIERNSYTPGIRSCVRNMVVYNCPMYSIGPVFDGIYQLVLKPLLKKTSRPENFFLAARTVARIVAEGGIAADIQLVLEMKKSFGKPTIQLCL